jgi:hypothetical protein
MSKVVADMSMSLDGFVAGPDDGSSTSSAGSSTVKSACRQPILRWASRLPQAVRVT